MASLVAKRDAASAAYCLTVKAYIETHAMNDPEATFEAACKLSKALEAFGTARKNHDAALKSREFILATAERARKIRAAKGGVK